MRNSTYPADTGPYAQLSDADKKKRLDAMVRVWQREMERRFGKEPYREFISSLGLDEYRYAVVLRFPEWDRRAVIGQVVSLQRSLEAGAPEDPAIFSWWKHDPLLVQLPDWKRQLPAENVFNIQVRLTPGGLGEGSRWAVAMPKEFIPRYRPGWPRQKDWVEWTNTFDWISVAVGFIRIMLDALEAQRSEQK